MKRERGEDGIAVKGVDENGKPFIVDRDYKPQIPGTEILERGVDGRPVKAVARSVEAINKLLKSMNVDRMMATFEEKFEASPTLKFELKLGGHEAFRGILKIAYEYVRGVLDVPSTDAVSEAAIHDVLLNDADPVPFVGWLPYEMLPAGEEAPFFSHRVIAWFDGTETLVIVELFNCLPFIVRLPGIAVPRPELYVKGVQGGEPLTGTMNPAPTWKFSDVPVNPQAAMLPGFEERIKPILETMKLNMFVRPTAIAMVECFAANAQVTEVEMVAFVTAEFVKHTGRQPVPEEAAAAAALVHTFLPLLQANPGP